MDINKVVYLKQIHSDIFHIVDEQNYLEVMGKEGDAIITSAKGIAMVFLQQIVFLLY